MVTTGQWEARGGTGYWPLTTRVRHVGVGAVGVAAVVREVAGIATAETEDYSVINTS